MHVAFGVKTRELAVAEANQGINAFYTREPFCFADTPVEVVEPNNLLSLWGGRAYLRSKPNGTVIDNLLSLPRVGAPEQNALMAMGRALSR